MRSSCSPTNNLNNLGSTYKYWTLYQYWFIFKRSNTFRSALCEWLRRHVQSYASFRDVTSFWWERYAIYSHLQTEILRKETLRKTSYTGQWNFLTFFIFRLFLRWENIYHKFNGLLDNESGKNDQRDYQRTVKNGLAKRKFHLSSVPLVKSNWWGLWECSFLLFFCLFLPPFFIFLLYPCNWLHCFTPTLRHVNFNGSTTSGEKRRNTRPLAPTTLPLKVISQAHINREFVARIIFAIIFILKARLWVPLSKGRHCFQKYLHRFF